MRYRKLGRSGLRVSEICLGCMSYGDPGWRSWVLPEEEGRSFIRRAWELGINFFDTADMYSRGVSEKVLGRALREIVPRREEVVIATKVFFPMGAGPNQRGLSRKHVIEACEASLGRLGTDYVDLYQIHRWDPHTPIEETLHALDRLVRDGKVLYLGASSMYAWQLARALCLADHHGWSRFVSMQNHYNLVYREEEREMLPLCLEEGLGVIPWSPLARGFLTGMRSRSPEAGETERERTDHLAPRMYYQPEDFEVVEAVAAVARERGVTPAQVALAWLLRQQGVTAPIVGATRLEHLEQAVSAAEITLSDEECRRVEAPYRPHPVLGHG
jgi:aryl-alcohol dehydrogenase-like predicted oxidoreductase